MKEVARQRTTKLWEDPQYRLTRIQKRGVEHSSSKLTVEQVQEIRRMYATGEYTQMKLATMFPVHQTIISDIVRNKRYKFN